VGSQAPANRRYFDNNYSISMKGNNGMAVNPPPLSYEKTYTKRPARTRRTRTHAYTAPTAAGRHGHAGGAANAASSSTRPTRSMRRRKRRKKKKKRRSSWEATAAARSSGAATPAAREQQAPVALCERVDAMRVRKLVVRHGYILSKQPGDNENLANLVRK
jgi:hypothetical protein